MSESNSTAQGDLFSENPEWKCRKCGELKPESAFPRAVRGRRWRRGTCQKCCNLAAAACMKTPHGRAVRKALKAKYKATIKYTLSAALGRARARRPADTRITLEDLLALFEDQKGRCAISGLEMTWGGKTSPTSLSLDRIDRHRGYEAGNVRLVCWQANTFRNRWDDADMLRMAHAIVEHLGRSVPANELPSG